MNLETSLRPPTKPSIAIELFEASLLQMTSSWLGKAEVLARQPSWRQANASVSVSVS